MTTDFRGDAIKPRGIHADRAGRQLTIDWADGHHSVFDLTTLRWLCPCAFCRGEAGQPGWLDSSPTLSDDQVELTDVSLVGHYAIQPAWADGHSTGFYTFESLREACPCPQHQEARAPGAAPGAAAPGAAAPSHQHE